MIQKIRDELFRIGKKVNREQLFELCPIYFFTCHQKSDKHIQYILNNLRYDLANRELFASRSNVLLYYHLSYDSTESQLKLYDESGNYKNSLDKWLSYISVKYHIDCGIIMVNIEENKSSIQDHLWWKQFFSDLHKHKKKFLFFISCSLSFSSVICSMFEKEFFIMTYQIDKLMVEDYFNWCISQMKEYPINIDETTKMRLKNILEKYESDINYHILEIWMNSILWNYYSREELGTLISFDSIAGESLTRIIEKSKENDSLKIGFC